MRSLDGVTKTLGSGDNPRILAMRCYAVREGNQRPNRWLSNLCGGSSDESPLRVESLTGVVARGPFGTGSKSEREAIWLETAGHRLVLRRKNGPSATALDKYVGKHVKRS